jgi:hypothetical protein
VSIPAKNVLYQICEGVCDWASIQKPVVTYDLVSYYKKQCVQINLKHCQVFFFHQILPFLLNIAGINIEKENKY